MKIYNKIIALVAALGLVGVSFAQDEAAGGNLTDNISIAGFIDASYATGESTGNADTEQLGIDEVEIDFLFGFGSVAAEVHADGDGTTLGIEQAFITYDVGNGIGVKIGKYGSALGLEREDPGGLYTVSRAYTSNALNLGDADNNTNEGVTFSYSADEFSVGVSFEDSDGADATDTDKLNTTVSVSYTGIENFSIGGGIASGNGLNTTDTTNIHATYNAGKALIAVEYTELDATGTANDVDATMILVDYDVSDKLGIVVRYSEEDGATAAGDNEKLTIAPNYAITDNLGAILEFSDGEEGASSVESVALELTLTF
jgi:hypothetical protein